MEKEKIVRKLLDEYIRQASFDGSEKLLDLILFLNSAVLLAVEGSNTLVDLQKLSASGTKILACGTCLNYYDLTGKLAVGEVTDMFGITNHLAAPGKLITL